MPADMLTDNCCSGSSRGSGGGFTDDRGLCRLVAEVEMSSRFGLFTDENVDREGGSALNGVAGRPRADGGGGVDGICSPAGNKRSSYSVVAHQTPSTPSAMNLGVEESCGGGRNDGGMVVRKSANMTECVAVPSSEHVAEIVGRQGE